MKYYRIFTVIVFVALGTFLSGCYTQLSVEDRHPHRRYYNQNQSDNTSAQNESSDTNYTDSGYQDENNDANVNNNYYDGGFYPHHRYYWGYYPSFAFSVGYDPIWDDPFGYWYNPFYPAYCYNYGFGFGYNSWYYGFGHHSNYAWYNQHNNYGYRQNDIGRIRNDIGGRGVRRVNSITTSRTPGSVTRNRDGRNTDINSARAGSRTNNADVRTSSRPTESGRSFGTDRRANTPRNQRSDGTSVRKQNTGRDSRFDNRGRNYNPFREQRNGNNSMRPHNSDSRGSAPRVSSQPHSSNPSSGSGQSRSGGERKSESSSRSRGR